MSKPPIFTEWHYRFFKVAIPVAFGMFLVAVGVLYVVAKYGGLLP